MTIPLEITTLVFDWGDTLMTVDPRFSGAMGDWPEVTAVPGVQTALAALQGRFRLAVASNAVDSNAIQVHAALERVGLAGLTGRYPDQIVALRGCTPAVLALQAELAAAGFAPQDLVVFLRKANNR